MSTTTAPEAPHAAPVISVKIDEAVRITGLSRTTLWRLESRGKLKPSRVGRCKVYLVKDLKKFVEEGSK